MGKRTKQKCKQCGAQLEVTYEGNGVQYPVFTCEKHGSSTNEWQRWWENYSTRWKERKYWDNPLDKVSCIVGFFCNVYEKFYGHPFTLDILNPIPYKSKTFTMARRILAMFENDAHEIRIYIKWVFAKKVKTIKYPVTSLGFFANASFVNEYKHAKYRSTILKRHSPLPQDFIQWCNDNCPEIFEKQELKTWNDLNALVTYVKSYGKDTIENKVVLEAVNKNMLSDCSTYRKLED